MGRTGFKWKCIIIFYLTLLNLFIKCLPVYEKKLPSMITTETKFKNAEIPLITEDFTVTNKDNDVESKTGMMRSQIRPGQTAAQYHIQITNEGDTYNGRAVIDVISSMETIDNQLQFHVQGLTINSVEVGLFTAGNTDSVNFNVDGNRLRINPPTKVSDYVVIIEYTGHYSSNGRGFHKGSDGNGSYLAMNLHPIYARRVFPCLDEPTESSMIKFTFDGLEYNHFSSNAKLEDDSTSEFRGMQGAPHVFGMMAHNFININQPIQNVLLYTRSGMLRQDAPGLSAVSFYFNNLLEWTGKDYWSIHADQDGRLNIVAVPDIVMDWRALSTVPIWEPYILMQTDHAEKQWKVALFEIAQALSKQWFGALITPQNWRFEWVVSGLASYSAYEMMRLFQEDSTGTDITILDVDALFLTDIIQESLLLDSLVDSQPLEPDSNLFDEEPIRNHVNGILKFKAPALLRMMRIVLGDSDQDFIQSAARTLLNRRPMDPIGSLHLVSGINSDWIANGNDKKIDNVNDYLNRWKSTVGYPVITVSQVQGGVLVMQKCFSIANDCSGDFPIPITFTTSADPNFSDYQPIVVADNSRTFEVNLGDDDWILFNIQGQGYYRVNYNVDLWERIIEALGDPERREEIHPLNRATLVDDSMNLARSGQLDYEIPLKIILTMEHETQYAVWKAFVRNMEFLRKRLVALITTDDGLDQDIYVRMVRRTILALEEQLGFQPDTALAEPAMDTLTRGLVMEHACIAKYDPCIAAAIDLFYDPNNEGVVNPNIPHDIRPAVYCTMVKEGDEEVIDALNERLEIEPTIYERVVILESLACSEDEDYIKGLLQDTISDESPYSIEERNKILAAVIRSNYRNVFISIEFMSSNTHEIVEKYGGMERFEQLMYILADNIADEELTLQFRIWVTSQHNNLGDMDMTVQRAMQRVNQNTAWINAHLEDVYEWIDANHASTTIVSFAAICVSLMVALMNH